MCLRVLDSRDFIPGKVLRVSLLLRKFQGEGSRRTASRNFDTPDWTAPHSEVHDQVGRIPSLQGMAFLSLTHLTHHHPFSARTARGACLCLQVCTTSEQLWSINTSLLLPQSSCKSKSTTQRKRMGDWGKKAEPWQDLPRTLTPQLEHKGHRNP